MQKKLAGILICSIMLIFCIGKMNIFGMGEPKKKTLETLMEETKIEESPGQSAKMETLKQFIPSQECPLRPGFMEFLYDNALSDPQLKVFPDTIRSVSMSPDGRRALIIFLFNGIYWNIQQAKRIGPVEQHDSVVESVAFIPHENTMMTISGEAGALLKARIKRWDLKTGEQKGEDQILEFGQNAGMFFRLHLALSPDGSKVLIGLADLEQDKWVGTAKLWNVRTNTQIGSNLGTDAIEVVVFSPDGNKALTGSINNKVKIWDIKTGKQIGSDLKAGAQIKSAAFSPDGSTVVIAVNYGAMDTQGEIQLWDVKKSKKIWNLKPGTDLGINEGISVVAFSPDGSKIATGLHYGNLGEWKGAVRIWNVKNGKQIGLDLKHDDSIESVAFIPNTKKILIGFNRKIAIWDLELIETTYNFLQSLTIAQCELLVSIDQAMQKNPKTNRPWGRIHATPIQWDIFTTFPMVVQERLKKYIKKPEAKKE